MTASAQALRWERVILSHGAKFLGAMTASMRERFEDGYWREPRPRMGRFLRSEAPRDRLRMMSTSSRAEWLPRACVAVFLVAGFGLMLWPRSRTMDQTLAWVRAEFPAVPRLQSSELAAWMADPQRDQPALLDVRTAEEYAVSHLPGAVRVEPTARVRDVLDRHGEQKALVTYCSVGYRSSQLAEALIGRGRTNVFNLEGSIFAWANGGYPLERAGRPVTEVHPYSWSYVRLINPEHRRAVSVYQSLLNELPPPTRWKVGSAAVVMFLLLIWESWRPFFLWFRGRPGDRLGHGWTNCVLGLINIVLGGLLFVHVWIWAGRWAAIHQFGLLHWMQADGWVRFCASILLLDCWTYWWHRLNHSVPLFWRFHKVHHTETRLDVTSANRFHFGELIFSSMVRVPIIVLAGVSFGDVVLYETFMFAVVQLHHANISLPAVIERALGWVIVTPNLHRVHHSKVPAETDSNYASLLSLWDRIFRTRRWRNPEEIEFGLDGYEGVGEGGLVRTLEVPID
jgi:sterol desaturase/sphingolipid hydroxylase (fatty acid hydroxylase superfamily)/rhodanese-related sulfurtransferase